MDRWVDRQTDRQTDTAQQYSALPTWSYRQVVHIFDANMQENGIPYL